MDDDLSKRLEDCFRLLDENIDVLANLERNLEDEKEDELVPDMKLHQLFDMTEDVSESSKIKRAEFNLSRRQAE
ncbi:MAG: hypothetical protein OEL77_09095 [Nitrosopumilus sp.]|nr:hypothetical protein [Nitrosopumilus sp.]